MNDTNTIPLRARVKDPDGVHCAREDGSRWRGSSMDIYARPGTKVIYHGTFTRQVRWGGCDDPRARLVLEQEYTVHHTEVHGSWTGVYLEEFEHLMFPAMAFHAPGAPGTWELPCPMRGSRNPAYAS